jgi:hypothetical protein
MLFLTRAALAAFFLCLPVAAHAAEPADAFNCKLDLREAQATLGALKILDRKHTQDDEHSSLDQKLDPAGMVVFGMKPTALRYSVYEDDYESTTSFQAILPIPAPQVRVAMLKQMGINGCLEIQVNTCVVRKGTYNTPYVEVEEVSPTETRIGCWFYRN